MVGTRDARCPRWSIFARKQHGDTGGLTQLPTVGPIDPFDPRLEVRVYRSNGTKRGSTAKERAPEVHVYRSNGREGPNAPVEVPERDPARCRSEKSTRSERTALDEPDGRISLTDNTAPPPGSRSTVPSGPVRGNGQKRATTVILDWIFRWLLTGASNGEHGGRSRRAKSRRTQERKLRFKFQVP